MNLLDFKLNYSISTPIELAIKPNIYGWNSESVSLEYVINTYKPESIVEVGSWLGASAIYMASLTNSPILCVDTFLGSNEVLWRENKASQLVNNFDGLYRQFCANITHKQLNNQVSPLPMTSSSAAELLARLEVTVDMVYLDAGHREREVYADLQDWWPLTNKVLIGDDYNSHWPGVIAAADKFAVENNINLEVMDNKFILEKVPARERILN